MAHKIWDAIEKLGSDVEVYWILRELNGIADFVSRIVDVDNWSDLDSIFQNMNISWGPFEVDMFSDENNRKCEMFVSRWCSEGCSAVDAFSEAASRFWSRNCCWWVPPPYLIVNIIPGQETL